MKEKHKLQVKQLHKKYGNETVLSDVNFDLQQGDTLVLFGRNGVGKTTLIKCIAELIKYHKGSVYCNVHKEKRGLTLGEELLLPSLNIDEYLNFICQLKDIDNSATVINNIINELFLTDFRKKPIKNLSLGNKSKVALASCLVYNPHLMLLDEPFKGFDILSSKQVVELLNKRSKTAITIISTHNISVIRLLESPYIGVLDKEKGFKMIAQKNYKNINEDAFEKMLLFD